MSAPYAKAAEPLVGDVERLEEALVFLIVNEPIDNTPSNSFEPTELHEDSGSGSGLALIIGDGFAVPIYPVQDVELQPRDST